MLLTSPPPRSTSGCETTLKRGKFPALSAPPRIDVFTLFVGTTEGSNQPDFLRAAQTLPPQLLAHDGLAKSIRRIAGISVALSPPDQITGEVLFAWERTDDHRRLNRSGRPFDQEAQEHRPVPYGVTEQTVEAVTPRCRTTVESQRVAASAPHASPDLLRTVPYTPVTKPLTRLNAAQIDAICRAHPHAKGC